MKKNPSLYLIGNYILQNRRQDYQGMTERFFYYASVFNQDPVEMIEDWFLHQYMGVEPR